MTSWIERHIDGLVFHTLVAVGFVLLNVVGYLANGLDFVLDWGGGFAAVIATFFLVFKRQGYWVWMIVNASLWCYLWFHVGAPLLGWLQVSFLVFCTYGFIQWALVNRIGFKFSARPDKVGAALAVGFFIVTAYVYWPRDGMTTWWALEAGATFFAVGAVVLDAFKYRANWISWTISNCVGFPLYWHFGLWGVVTTTFIYQAINVWGWIVWTKDQRQPIIEEMEGYPDDYSLHPDPVVAEKNRGVVIEPMTLTEEADTFLKINKGETAS